MFSERAEIIGKIIAEFVAEMIRDNLKKELFLEKKGRRIVFSRRMHHTKRY